MVKAGVKQGRRHIRRTRVISVLVGVLAFLVIATVAARHVYFHAESDPVDTDQVDAILILGPPAETRLEEARRLSAEAGGVRIYVSVHEVVRCDGEFTCVHADPWTTKGEAALLLTLMERDGVQHPVVLTGTTHLPRARYIMHRCVNDQIPVVGVDDELDLAHTVYEPIYQTGAFLKAVLTSC